MNPPDHPMRNCPTCNADLKGSPICRRCKTDLTQALAAAERAEGHFLSAARACAEGQWEAMFHHARRAFSLRRSPRHARMLACAAVLQKDYHLALSTWALIRSEALSQI